MSQANSEKGTQVLLYDLPSSDALPQSNRRLVGARKYCIGSTICHTPLYKLILTQHSQKRVFVGQTDSHYSSLQNERKFILKKQNQKKKGRNLKQDKSANFCSRVSIFISMYSLHIIPRRRRGKGKAREVRLLKTPEEFLRLAKYF